MSPREISPREISPALHRRHQGDFVPFAQRRVTCRELGIHREEEPTVPVFEGGIVGIKRVQEIPQYWVIDRLSELERELAGTGEIAEDGEKKHIDPYRHDSDWIHSSFSTPMTGRLRYSPQ